MKSLYIFSEEANAVSLKFKDKVRESEYKRYYIDKYLWQIRLAHLLAILFFALSSLNEFLVIDVEYGYLILRTSFVIVSFLIGHVLSYVAKDFYKKYFTQFNTFYVSITSLSFIIAGATVDAISSTAIYTGIFVCLIFNYTFIRHDFIKASISGFILIAIYCLVAFSINEAHDNLIMLSVNLSVVHFLGMFICYTIEYDSRNSFLLINQIQKDKHVIKEANKNLEHRIEERTQELQEAKDKAEESDRLKSAFLANMSHEIRTPMNGILGFLELLKSTEVTEEEQKSYIHMVNESGQRLLTTINDIIEISRIESGEMTLSEDDVDISRMIYYLLDVFQLDAAKRGLVFKGSLSGDIQGLHLKTDQHKLESILVNFINNAMKFTKEGSVKILVHKEAEELVFCVRDTGIGIPEAMQASVFERFMQADLRQSRGHEGSGLGLPICKAYAEKMGGRIWVESEVGEGSSFYLALPISNLANSMEG